VSDEEVCTVCHESTASHEIAISCQKTVKKKETYSYEYNKPSFSAYYLVCMECAGKILDVKIDVNLTRRSRKP